MKDARKIASRLFTTVALTTAVVAGLVAGSWRAAHAGLQAQGLQAQGLQAQGLQAQGLQAQGLQAQGLQAQGLQAQGLQAQGLQAQGLQAQGLQAQGLQAQGVGPMGTDVVGGELKGVDIGSVEIRGTTSDSPVGPVELTANPGMSTGAGSYISIDGYSAVGHYAIAHLVDAAGNPAEDLDLFIAGERPDPVPNLLHRADSQVNEDVTLYEVYFFHKWSGQWASLCPVHTSTGGATAMAIAEDPANPSKFIFACTATGVAAKCARIWGFRPWRTETSWFFDDVLGDWVERDFEMKPFYDACTTAARAGYCQDRQSFTKTGTLVDLFDTRQLVWPNTIENPWNELNDDSLWMFAQEYFVSSDPLASDPSLKTTALQRTRYRELSPQNACASFASIDRLEHDHFEDGRWANPLTNTPRIEVFSPNYCTHNEAETGEALPWDCSPCTTAICRKHPECCSADPTLPQPVWNATCVAERAVVCQDVEGGGGPLWPLGKVWPRDVPPGPAAFTKYLIGPAGAVDGVSGVSTGGTSATVEGWACDPEWPGAAVTVAVYGGAPREHGGVFLGQAYADRALASTLAPEVAAACDGPNKTTARHGFSFALPAGTSGNVFVYALDAATADGPAAPPTLIRNGIVHVPTCPHSEHVTGDFLDGTCSACATSVCAQEGLAGCCTTEWTAECAAAADACAPADASAAANGRNFAQVLTGWIEAPATGTYVFSAGVQPSRVFVNGKKLVDWWDGPGPTSGAIELMGGGKYSLRWDRFQASPGGSGSDPGLTWQPPGAVGQQAIPAANLYRVTPGAGTGLRATYYDNLGWAGPSATRLDAGVDLSSATVLPAGVNLPTYSTQWDGEIVPLYTETYTFTVVAAGKATLEIDGSSLISPPVPAPPLAPGCSHDICALGDKLAATTLTESACDPCVDQICAKDPFCCNGGYLSYYSTEPVWDAKCVAEVGAICGLSCKNPLPSPSTQQLSGTIALQAGVHYRLRLRVETSTTDRTVQLVWASPRQMRGTVPSTSLYPPGPAVGRGAGMNVVSFATKNGGTQPDLDTLRAAGAAPDFSLAPAPGPNGLPVVPVLAAPDDPAAGVPAQPILVIPQYQQEVFSAAPEVIVQGLGGITGGSVRVKVQGTAIDVVTPVLADGTFKEVIPVGAYGVHTLELTQRTYPGVTCSSPPAIFCASSAPLTWEVTVSPVAPAVPPAPVITSPRDPTASPNPANDQFAVTGRANPGPVNVCDLGGGSSLTPSVMANGNGIINGTIQLTNGSGNPNKGWHKIVFTKGASCAAPVAGGSSPVFISVGIRPPTVEFPRTGAEIECPPDPNEDPTHIDVKGSIPYSQVEFGPLRIYEETGRRGLELVRKDVGVDQTPQPDGSFRFQGSFNLTPGKHLVYFFQAPEPPPNARPDEIEAHWRAFASIADTPRSRIEIIVPPPPIQFPIRGQLVVTTSPLLLQATDCAPGQTGGPGCALPFADVNVRVGPRTWTARANNLGAWKMSLDLAPGWHPMRIAQVVDSRAGGGWQESCPNDDTVIGVVKGDPKERPTLNLPDGPLRFEATGREGAKVPYNASATTVTGKPAEINCVPRSGATFPIGQTPVFCTAIDPDTHAVAVGGFFVEVVDGAPVLELPKGIVAEATSPLGALVHWNAEADDAVSGPVPIECVPSSPALFALDEERSVSCSATDGAGHTTTDSFPVVVRDRTPPTMCALPDLKVLASGPGGGIVTFKTCASDIVDGDKVPVSCGEHPSGSFFPVGKTLVTCTATDRHQNVSAAEQFIVEVGDSTPPVLKLPADITVVASTRQGAKVGYTVTATDDTDPKPVVSCSPKSGSVFLLGTTKVNCTATDVSGHQSKGSFSVRVVIAFGGFLAPINNKGTSVFLRPVPIPVRIALTDGSLGATDLQPRLFLARLDANGKPGPEQPAQGIPPVVGNLFLYNPLLREYDLTIDIRTLAAGPWQLRADLGDAVPHTVKVTLR